MRVGRVTLRRSPSGVREKDLGARGTFTIAESDQGSRRLFEHACAGLSADRQHSAVRQEQFRTLGVVRPQLECRRIRASRCFEGVECTRAVTGLAKRETRALGEVFRLAPARSR